MFRSPPQPMWDLTIHPSILARTHSLSQSMWDPLIHPFEAQHSCWHIASCPPPFGVQPLSPSLAHHPVFNSNTICNSSSPPRTDIVLFGFSLLNSLKVLKRVLLGRGFHTLIKNVSLSSPTDIGSHNSPPFGAQRPR